MVVSSSTPEKSCFCVYKIEYLFYHVTPDGVMPIPKTFEAIQYLAVPKNRKQLHHFIGMINFYRDMCQKRFEVLAPINYLNLQKRQIGLERRAPKMF